MKKNILIVALASMSILALAGCKKRNIEVNTSEDKTSSIVESSSNIISQSIISSSSEASLHTHTAGEVKYDEEGHYTVCSTCGEEMTSKVSHTLKSEARVEPKCEEDGVENFSCTGCGYKEEKKIPAPGHKFSTEYKTDENKHAYECLVCGVLSSEDVHVFERSAYQAPDCESTGFETFECKVCHYTKTNTIDKLPHNFAYVGISDECHEYKCSVCGTVESTSNHEYEIVSEVNPTCLEAGEKIEKCKTCGHTKKSTKEALGHGSTVYFDNGDTHQIRCEVCNEILEEKPHNFELIRMDSPSCTEDGTKVERCAKCKKTITTPIPSEGHNFVYKINGDAGHEYECSICGFSKGSVPHNYRIIETVESSCTKAGYVEKKCSDCEFTFYSPIESKGHVEIYTDNGDGTHDSVCDRCGETLKSKESHVLDYSLLEATNNSAGYKDENCIYCSYVNHEDYPHLGDHRANYEKGLVLIDDDNHGYECAVEGCGAYVGVSGHSYMVEYPIKYPTDEEAGIMGYRCPDCHGVLSSPTDEFNGDRIDSLNVKISLPRAGDKISDFFEVNGEYPNGVYVEAGGYEINGIDFIFSESNDILDEESFENISAVFFYVTFDYFGAAYPIFNETTGAPDTEVTINGVKATKPMNELSSVYSDIGVLSWYYEVKGEALTQLLNHSTHSFESVSNSEPDCVNDGVLVSACTVCGYKNVTTSDKLGHDFECCSVDENEHSFICSRCGEVESSAAHNMEEIDRKSPSCTETGYVVSECGDCGYKATEILPIEHVSLNCVDNGDGTHTFSCSNCETTIKSEEHNLEDVIVKAPGSVTVGEKKEVCKDCGFESETISIPHSGTHNMDSTYTPIDDMKHGHQCIWEGCEFFFDSQNHLFSEYPISYPDGDEPGVMGRYCRKCGYVSSSVTYEYTGVKADEFNLSISLPKAGETIENGLKVLSQDLPFVVKVDSFVDKDDNYYVASQYEEALTQEIIDSFDILYVLVAFDFSSGYYVSYGGETPGVPDIDVNVNGVSAIKPASAGNHSEKASPLPVYYWIYTISGETLQQLLSK
ncbi:MAG: hypothetical protein MJ241_04990 [Bacilli bacterium]|nr:hypothetical protein [Bacilli bacterium]